MRGPYASSANKLLLLESILDECTRFQHKFKDLSSLAEYCVLRMNDRKTPDLVLKSAETDRGQVGPVLVEKGMHYRSLLRKGSSYRRLLDIWMNANCGSRLSLDQARIHDLEHKLLKLSNEHVTIKRLYTEQLESTALLEHKGTPKAYLDDAFAIVEILLRRFSGDVIIEDGAVKERSVVRTVYVSQKLMKPYMDWLDKALT